MVWYGGDGAYLRSAGSGAHPVAVGDTFVAHEEGIKDRVDMDVVLGTTLAISTCSANNNLKFNII